MAAQDTTSFKIYSHERAAVAGFYTSLKPNSDGSATATPAYPGVALYTVNPKTGKKAAEALVQIIPADTTVVYSNVVVSGAKKDELTINMNCHSKDSSTPVRFLLGNLSDDATRFTITDGKTTIIDLVVNPRSYSKLPGTDGGKEVILADSGLACEDASQQGCRPATGTCYTITIGKPRAETRGVMGTFDNSALNLHSITPPPIRQRPYGLLLAQCDGPGGDEQCDGPGFGEDVCDGPGGGMTPTSCVSAVTDRHVDKCAYRVVDFKSEVVFAVKIYFAKTLYVAPEPVVEPVDATVETTMPQFVVCGGSDMFFCQHEVHLLKSDPETTVNAITCPCIYSTATREYALRSVILMMME